MHPIFYKLNLHVYSIRHFLFLCELKTNISKGRAIWSPPPRSLRIKFQLTLVFCQQPVILVFILVLILVLVLAVADKSAYISGNISSNINAL